MKLKLSWEEYKKFAMDGIKADYLNAVDDDTIEFRKEPTSSSDGTLYEYPEYVLINLED